MSTGFIGADDAIKKEITLDEVQPLLLQIIVIFDCDGEVVNKAGEDFNVYSSEPKLLYDNIAAQLKQRTNFNGEIKSEIIYVNEFDSQCIEVAKQEIKNLAESYLVLGYSDVNIEVYIPSTAYRSIYVDLLILVLDVDNKHSFSTSTSLDKIKFSNNRIKITNISPISVDSDTSSPSIDSSEVFPNTTDARVAAVLCEYTYYISRINEYHELYEKKSFWEKLSSPIDSVVNLVANRWKKEGIIHGANEIGQQVNDLDVIPERWKNINKFKHVSEAIESNVANNSNDESSKANSSIKRELLKWDALCLDLSGWLGMCDHSIDWEDSLAYTVVKKIQEDADKRFTFTGSKGALNKWFIFGGNTGFSSVLFVNETDRILMYCTAGSDMGGWVYNITNGDWITTNLLQGLCGLSRQYQQSVTNALILDRAVNAINEEERGRKKPIKLLFIGHSLGGGLAGNNAIVTKNRHAITFNAAGLNWLRVAISLRLHNREERQSSLKGRDRVHSFIIRGEILDVVQTVAQTVIPLLVVAMPGSALIDSVLKPHLKRAYSAPSAEHFIDSAISTEPGDKHGIVNFIKPTEQILKINL